MTRGTLDGIAIGVTAERRAAEQIKMLEQRGATCLHGPVITTHIVEDTAACITNSLLRNQPTIIVATTGLGVTGWLDAAERDLVGDRVRSMFADAELIARGPKARRTLESAGFEVSWTAPDARYDDVVTEFEDRGVNGVRVAVQLDGAGAEHLCDQIEALGAEVVRVPVYRWSLPADLAPARRLVDAIADRQIKAVTFTARPAVENLLEIAGIAGRLDETVEALARDVAVFCVGPVCAAGLTDDDIAEPHVPDKHRLGAMVQLLSRHFQTAGEQAARSPHGRRATS